MPFPSQPIDGNSDLWDFSASELHNLVRERRRTDSDKSNLGIPADDDDFLGGLDLDFEPLTGFPSASQASRSQSSWETISATSHGTSHSFQNPVLDQHDQRWENLHIPKNPPLITLNGLPTQSVSGTDPVLKTLSTSSSSGGPWAPDHAVHSQGLADSPDPTSSTPNTLSPDSDREYFDPQWLRNIVFADRIGADEAQAAPQLYPGLVDERDFPPVDNVSQYQQLYQGLNHVDPTDTSSGASQPAIEPLDSRGPESERALDASLQHSHARKSHDTAAKSQNTKRKRQSASARDNVDKINAVRKKGACLRCIILHEVCDRGDPCTSCERNQSKAKIWKQPCVRLRLRTVEIHRNAALSFPEGIRKLSWTSTKTITLSLYNVGFADLAEPPSLRPHLQVVCREFRTVEGDPLAKSWISGGQRVNLRLPAYAIPSSQHASLNNSLDKLMQTYFHKLLDELKYGQHEIVAMTLVEATRNVDNCPMLRGALDIAIMTRLAMRSFNITGPETLGIDWVEDPQSPYYRRIPIPPLLDAQLDHLWMGKMSGRRKLVLSQLKKLIMDKTKRRENWYMIFLTILVLLSNLELIYRNQYQQRQRYGTMNDRRDIMMDSWQHAAETLNAYFHAICHGNVPLTMDWDEEAKKDANLDVQALNFLSALKVLVASHVEELSKRPKDPPHTPLVWILALFSG